MNIEIAKAEDAKEILGLQKRAFHQEAARYNDFSIRPVTETLEEYLHYFEIHDLLIVREHGTIIGAVAVRAEEGTAYIGRLVVEPKRQGEGIAGKLLTEAEKRYDSVKRYELFTGSLSEKNLAIYSHRGYREFKREPMEENIEMVFMEKFSEQDVL